MPPRGRAISRPLPERLAAWVLLGPLGRLWSVVADVLVLWARYALARARGRTPWERGAP